MFCTAKVGWLGRRVYVELDPAILYKAPRAFVDVFDDVGTGQVKVERVCVSDLRDIEPDRAR
jgi:hypothetical protein